MPQFPGLTEGAGSGAMTPRIRAPAALSARDLMALDLLILDREECGGGVTRAALEAAGHTHYVGSMCGRLRAHGHSVGLTAGGLYQLGHDQLLTAFIGESTRRRS